MTIAIMQPYLFPYIGYFQMIHAADKFVFYDDVNYIKRGWINRNKILNQEKDLMFTVPLVKPSQNRLINQTYINPELYNNWKNNFLQTLSQSYKKAPFYEEAIQPIEAVLNQQYDTISELAIESCRVVSEFVRKNPVLRINSILSFQVNYEEESWPPFLLQSEFKAVNNSVKSIK